MSQSSLSINSSACESQRTLISNQEATLDGLATELKVAILKNVPDISTLCALVHSSPLYHGAYRSKRYSILYAVLFKHMPSLIAVESLAVLEMSHIPWENRWIRERHVHQFITRYKLQQHQQSTQFPLESLHIEKIAAMANLQLVIEGMTAKFCDSRCAINPVTCEAELTYSRPSPLETIRIQRAFYRYELFCTMFPINNSTHSDDPMDISHLFLSIYEPWENEEIACIHDFLTDSYEVILKQCADVNVNLKPLHKCKSFRLIF